MCSTFKFKQCVGRNFDYEQSYNEELRIIKSMEFYNDFEIIGMCTGLVKDYPLLYDGMNEKGLCVSALAFEGNAYYNEREDGKVNIPSFDFVFQILSSFEDVDDVKKFLVNVNITNESFSSDFPNSDLHWFIADKRESIIVEQTKNGLKWYDGEVMTNNPPYPLQNDWYDSYKNDIGDYPIEVYDEDEEWHTRGLESYGLDGGYTSDERFVRLTYLKSKLEKSANEFNQVNQSFHLCYSVEQLYGITSVKDKFEYTIYSVVYDMSNKEAYVKFYDDLDYSKNGLLKGSVKKRFEQFKLPSDVRDTENGKIYHLMIGNDGEDLCILLNDLHDEIQALKKENVMTEKRFTLNNVLNFDFGICDYGEPIGSLRNICELLNELSEQNQYLKSLKWNQDCINEISISIQQRQSLEEENEQLRQQLIEKERMLDVRDKIIADVMKAVNGDLE